MEQINEQYKIRRKMEKETDEGWGRFQSLPNWFLAKAARGEIDLNDWARIELAQRGLDRDGEWIGFDAAYKLFGIER